MLLKRLSPLAQAGAALWVIFAPKPAAAQADAGSVMVEAFPYASRDRGQVRTSLFKVSVGVPVALSKKTLLLPGASYERFEADVRARGVTGSLVLHAPMLSLLMIHTVSPRLTLMASASTGFASDFKQPVGNADVLGSGLALALYRFTPSLTVGAGVVYDRRTGTLLPAPMVLLNWKFSERLRLAGAAPVMVNVEYRTAPWMSTSLRASFYGNRYQFGEKSYTAQRLQLATSNLTVGPVVTFHRGDFLHLDVYASTAVYRRYEFLHDGDSLGDARLPVAVGYGLRLWVGPTGWNPPSTGPKQ